VIGFAGTRVSILRGTRVNDAGDIVDDNSTPAATGIPAEILEIALPFRDWFQTEAGKTQRHIRHLVARMPHATIQQRRWGVVVKRTDRLLDEADGLIYLVDRVVQQRGYAHSPDMRLVIRRV
jgi:hypothetical protein